MNNHSHQISAFLLSTLILLSGVAPADKLAPPPITPIPRHEPGDSSPGPNRKEKISLNDARELFRELRSVVDKDPKRADAVFEKFLTMPPPMQRRLLLYLDREWMKRKREVGLSRDDTSLSRLTLKRRRLAVAKHREALRSIWAIEDEKRMKAELKSRGWTAMQRLERLFKGTDEQSMASDQAMRQKQERALRIGIYRQKIRESLGNVPGEKPENALGIQSDASNKNIMRIPSQAGRIMKKNEVILKGLPKKEAEGIRELNRWRICAGLAPLVVDPKLCQAARDHCKDMATLGFFNHKSPVNGKRTPADRARRFGTRANGENIAINSSPNAANLSWFLSPGHHRNMFRPSYTIIGLGNHGKHYTQMFR